MDLKSILIVEDSNFDYLIITDMLSDVKSSDYQIGESKIDRAITLGEALQKINNKLYDVVLLDLTLKDSTGIDTLRSLYKECTDMPIIVLTGIDEKSMDIRALKEGAQDYLIKGQFNANLLIRSMYYSIERHKMYVALRSMALIDELTNLYNRRGFDNLAHHHIELAKRKKRSILLLYCDLDNFKWINDSHGHSVGDEALRIVGGLLKEIFRESDIIARRGGDEFIILTFDVLEEDKEAIVGRLHNRLYEYNKTHNCGYKLSMSVGAKYYEHTELTTIDDLLNDVDRLMYIDKKRKLERNKK